MQKLIYPKKIASWAVVAQLFHWPKSYEIYPQKPYYSFIYSVSCWNFTAAIFLPYTDKVSEFVFFVFYWQNNNIIIIIIEPAIHIL